MLKFIARSINQFDQFVHTQSVGDVVLALAALVALAVSNSPWRDIYEQFLQIPGELRLGGNWLVLSKPVLVWVNDLWMAVFFFLVGLEIKRELLEGELASPAQALLPAGAALGGMVVPGPDLCRHQLGRPGGIAGLGHPHGDRHRLCAWHSGAHRQPGIRFAQAVSDGGGHH